jgi:crossover junction endodeoxyribonuclease RuvC
MGVTGNGGASKEQVAFMVRSMLRMTTAATLDVTDALAVALCAAQRNAVPAAAAALRGRFP